MQNDFSMVMMLLFDWGMLVLNADLRLILMIKSLYSKL